MPWSMVVGILISTVIAGYVIGLTVMAKDVRERTWAMAKPARDEVLPHRGLTR
jgi:hypothetical protein